LKVYLRRFLKVVLWLLASIVLLVILVVILIQLPAVQNFAKNRVVAYLEHKIKTKVSIERLTLNFPKRIILEKVYVEDQRRDTLLYGDSIRVDIALLKLLKKQVEVNYVELNNIHTKIYRVKPDTAFNYAYIAKAFAGDTPADTSSSDTSGSLTYKLGTIRLRKITAAYRDDATGNDVRFYLGDFVTRITQFDPSRLVVAVPFSELSDVNASIRQYRPTLRLRPVPEEAAAAGAPLQSNIRLDTIGLKRIRFKYDDETAAMHATLDMQLLNVFTDKIDLQKTWVKLKKLELENTRVGITYDKQTTPVIVQKAAKAADSLQQLNWRVDLGELALRNNSLAYDDNNQRALKQGMDYSHLLISGFVLEAGGLAFTQDEYKGNIREISFREKSGFTLQKLSTAFLYNNKEAYLKDFVVQTPRSVIRNQLQARYPSAALISKNPGELFLDLQLDSSHVAVNDLLLAAPMLAPQLGRYKQSVLRLNGKAHGYVKDLSINNFEASGLGRTALQVSGTMQGLPDAQKAYYNINLKKLVTSSADIQNLLPRNSVPSNMRIPAYMSVQGNFKGSAQSFTTHVNARTSNGNLVADGGMKNKGASYNARIMLDKVNLGYILKQEKNIGTISLTANGSGSGTNYKKMTASLNAKLLEGNIKGYVYRNLTLNGNIRQGVVKAWSAMSDPHLRFKLETAADVKGAYPSLWMKLALDTADLRALHFVKDTFTLRGNVSALFSSTNPDSLQGALIATNLAIVKDSLRVSTDSIAITANRKQNIQSIALTSEMATADLTGEYRLTQIGTALQHVVNQYYRLPGFKDTAFAPENWQLNVKAQVSPLLLHLMPELKGTDTLSARIDFASEENKLDVQVNAPKIQYGQQEISHAGLYLQTAASQINYGLTLQRAGSKSFYVNQTALTGRIADNTVYTNLLIKDKRNRPHYQLALQLKPVENGLRFSFDEDSLMLNYDHWTVTHDNYIQYDSAGIRVHNLELSKNGQSLRVNSEADTANAPISAVFKTFNIKTLTNFAEQDSLLLDGVINGQALVKQVMSNPVFTADMGIENLSYKRDTIGNLAVKVNNEEANTFNADVSVTGNDNDVRLKGKYFTGDSRMDLQLAINNLNLAVVKGFSAGQLKDIKGALKGNVAIAGTMDKPNINGEVHFENAFITPTLLGEQFKMANEKIAVNSNGIHFDHFTLTDSANNKAIINGDILTSDFVNYKFGVDLQANDFRLVNATRADNPQFFGKLNVDANVKLRGDMQTPVINARLRANKATDFTFVLPSEDPEVVSREGVVHFISKQPPADSAAATVNVDTLLNTQVLRGIDFSADIETDSAAQFTLIVDERNGDALKIKGRADLAAGMDESGKLSLTGNYTLSSGSYQVTLSVLKRKFEVQNGSTITWTGDPMSANINITGVYEINTPSIDLVQDDISSRSGSEINRFKQKLPFQVLLKMTGELMKPQIKFDVVLPQEQQSQWKEVETKLEQLRNDESEMNKQVFALLLLGRFVQEDPLQSSAAGTSVETRVRQSVSNILADELNKLAGSLIKGVDLNFGLNTDDDYTTGTRQTKTDLTVGVSKSLLSDRLRVSVGSNFELEGPAAGRDQSSNIAGDVAVDYQLSKDGRYLLRAYRQNKYDGVVEGQVIETGLRFVFTLDYDRFWELFQSKKSYWNKRRQKRQNEQRLKQQNNQPSTDKRQ
jgi:hypothetical protein